MNDEELLDNQEETAPAPDPLASLAETMKANAEAQAMTNQMLQRLMEPREQAPVHQPQEEPEFETAEEKRIRQLEERITQLDQRNQQSELEKAADRKDRVIDYLQKHGDLDDAERKIAVEIARKYATKEYVGVQDVAQVVDIIAGKATIEARRSKPRESATGSGNAKGGKDTIDRDYADWIRQRTNSNISNEELVKRGFHQDEEILDQYKKARGRK